MNQLAEFKALNENDYFNKNVINFKSFKYLAVWCIVSKTKIILDFLILKTFFSLFDLDIFIKTLYIIMPVNSTVSKDQNTSHR